MKIISGLVGLIAILALAGCSGDAPAPSTPPLYVDPAPKMSERGHAIYIAERTFPVPAKITRGWIEEGRMLTLLESTNSVAKPAGYEVIRGKWPEVGSVRRMKQIDGHYLAETVLQNTDSLFAYQIYGFTGPAGRSVIYGRGKFEVISLSDNSSTLRWTYQLKPRNPLFGIFVRRFVENDFGPFMEGGMNAMAELAEKETTSSAQ